MQTTNEKTLTVGLFGIWGVYNYGCEAIVRGTEKILHHWWPNAKIIYYSRNFLDDRNRLNNCNVEIRPLCSWKGVCGMIVKAVNFLAWRINSLSYIRIPNYNFFWLKDVDVVLSIGGDIYTIPESFVEDSSENYYNEMIQFGKLVKLFRKKLVIWGASIGPFEASAKAKLAFFNHFKKDVDLITVREKNTFDYLKINGIHRIVLCGDPAFAVSGIRSTRNNSNQLKIAINLSPLSSRFSHTGQLIDSIIDLQAKTIRQIIRHYDAEIILLPHVVTDYSGDDDKRYLQSIYNQLLDCSDKIIVINDDLGFEQTKKILVECDLVIAARMHCAINAICCTVPTILLSYSSKAKGMAECIYGNRAYVQPLETICDFERIKPTIDAMLNKYELVCKHIGDRVIQIESDAMEAGESLVKLMGRVPLPPQKNYILGTKSRSSSDVCGK